MAVESYDDPLAEIRQHADFQAPTGEVYTFEIVRYHDDPKAWTARNVTARSRLLQHGEIRRWASALYAAQELELWLDYWRFRKLTPWFHGAVPARREYVPTEGVDLETLVPVASVI